MDIQFKRVTTQQDQETLAQLAHDIWNEYWPPLIGQDQVDYMVDQFQSLETIKRDMAQNGYEYWFITTTDPDDDINESEDIAEFDGLLGFGLLSDETPLGEQDVPLGFDGSEPRIIGYTGGHPEPETNRYFISKIYLLADERGHGVAKRVLTFYENHARELGLGATYLTVNKHNDMAVRSYEKNGFKTIESVETDIGEGYIMDDFIMERPVSQ